MSSNKRESKFKSLRFRLSVWYSGAFTIIFFLVFAIVHIYVYNHLLNLTDNNLFEKAKRHLWLGYPERTTVDVKDVRENFEFISSKEGSHDVFYFFLDSAYNIVAESSLEYWDGLTFDSTNIPYLPDRPGKDELKAFLNDKRNRELKTTVIPLNHEYRSHTILQTIKLDGRTDKIRVAYQFFNTNRLFITGISLQDNAKFTSILSRLFILTYVLLLIVVVVMVNLLTKKALDGVAKVTTTAVQIGKNNLGSRVPSENESTEIRTLAEAFNEMLDRIEQLMKEQRSMTHNIAHDLRSPITSIRGMAETTLTANSSVVDYELMSGRIIANCDRLVHLINSALDISDIESGNFKVETEDLLLSEVLMDCYEVYLPIAEEKKIDFSLAETKEDVKVKGNKYLLQRAFGNVVDNALKYTGNGGKISISTEETPGWNIVRISDNGIGIPEKELHRIFERFYRVDKSRSVEGNGLGLSLAKAYVEIHHGRIKVESIEGEGTTFLISLPAN